MTPAERIAEEPLPPLVTTSDPDYALYKAGDEEWLLRVASDAIRDYCGWHICPSITGTYRQLKIGSTGIVILPSRYVTDVSEVRYHDHSAPVISPLAAALAPPIESHNVAAAAVAANVAVTPYATTEVDPSVLDPSTYEWFQDGWIENIPIAGSGWVGYAPHEPYYQPTPIAQMVDVTMTHGYETLPANLKQIAFELASMSATTAGLIPGVKTIQSPQYSTTFTDAVKAGMSFSPDHMNVLNDYRLGGWFA